MPGRSNAFGIVAPAPVRGASARRERSKLEDINGAASMARLESVDSSTTIDDHHSHGSHVVKVKAQNGMELIIYSSKMQIAITVWSKS